MTHDFDRAQVVHNDLGNWLCLHSARAYGAGGVRTDERGQDLYRRGEEEVRQTKP